MEKSEFRVLIKHYFWRGKILSETKTKLDKYYSDSDPSYGMVQNWVTKFRTPKSPKTQKSAGKVMPSVFWDVHGVINLY